MSSDPRERHIDYIEFPAPSAHAFADVKRFYQDVFGWSFQEWGEEYADTRDSGVSVGISAAPAHRPAGTLAILYAANLEATKDRVTQAGGQIAKDIMAFPGGRRFEYIDPAGNRLGVWSDKGRVPAFAPVRKPARTRASWRRLRTRRRRPWCRRR